MDNENDPAVVQANMQQRALTDDQVRTLWAAWGNTSDVSISIVREILTNHFHDELMGDI